MGQGVFPFYGTTHSHALLPNSKASFAYVPRPSLPPHGSLYSFHQEHAEIDEVAVSGTRGEEGGQVIDRLKRKGDDQSVT